MSDIYLVDDHAMMRDGLRAVLEDAGHRVVGESDQPTQALADLGRLQPAVLLLDLQLGERSGFELLEQLSKRKLTTRTIVLTMSAQPHHVAEALRMGAAGYVLKGCSTEELIDAIEQIREGGAPISPLLARMLLRQFRWVQEVPTAAQELQEVLLSDRETEVLRLVAQGYVNKEIAQRLFISPATVGSHIKNLYRKLAVHSRVQVVRAAQQRGLL